MPNEQPAEEWRPFYSLFSEDWVFASSLTPEELSARLDASWCKPYRISSGGWKTHYISAVLQPHGWYFVKDRNLFANYEFPITRRNLTRQFDQRFSGRILATETGSRLVGRAGLNPPTMFGFVNFFILATLLFHFSTTFSLWLAVIIFAALCCYPNMFRARTKRMAIWKFLNAATQTPASDILVDDVARLTKEWREGIETKKAMAADESGSSGQANPWQ